jgi:hypothetical protein
LLLDFHVDEIAILDQFADQRVDSAQGQLWPALEKAADKAVLVTRSSSAVAQASSTAETPNSINIPLTTSFFKTQAGPAFQKTCINTMDAYVFYCSIFNLRSTSQAGRRRFDPGLPI